MALVIWIYVVVSSNVINAIVSIRKNLPFNYLSLLVYVSSFEMLGRMARAAPFIPSELGKYSLLFFSISGILIAGISSYKSFFLALILLPALFFDQSGKVTSADIIYNLLGPLSLALGLSLLYGKQITEAEMDKLLRLLWLTSVAALTFTFIRTPDLESIDFNLKAEFATAADSSSNQVATILGLGMFLSFYSVLFRKKFSGNLVLDIGFMLLFTFQGLLSFSRGGMIVGTLGMIILFVMRRESKFNVSGIKIAAIGIVAVIGIYAIFNIANKLTGGNLLLRYSGETEGTMLGSKEKNADVLVSGRLTIMNEDFDLWAQYPVLGAGVGASRYLRGRTYMVAPHTEFSRLVAEHGLLGLIFFGGLIFVFTKHYFNLPKLSNKGLCLAVFSIAILTTFHAAMRTYISPILFILSVISVQKDNFLGKVK